MQRRRKCEKINSIRILNAYFMWISCIISATTGKKESRVNRCKHSPLQNGGSVSTVGLHGGSWSHERQDGPCLMAPTGHRLLSVLAVGEGLPHRGPVMDLVVGVLLLQLGFAAGVALAFQAPPDLEGAHSVGIAVLLFLQLGVVVGKLVEENGDGHAVEDDTEGDAAEGHAAAQVGDGNHVAVAHGGDAHLREEARTG